MKEVGKQPLDRIYHCAKRQYPMWFDSGMSPETSVSNKRMNEHTNEQTHDAGKNNSPTPALWAGRGQ